MVCSFVQTIQTTRCGNRQVVCLRLASCVRELDVAQRRMDSRHHTRWERTTHIHLGESVAAACRAEPSWLEMIAGGTHDVEHRGPTDRLRFAGHGIVVDARDA